MTCFNQSQPVTVPSNLTTNETSNCTSGKGFKVKMKQFWCKIKTTLVPFWNDKVVPFFQHRDKKFWIIMGASVGGLLLVIFVPIITVTVIKRRKEARIEAKKVNMKPKRSDIERAMANEIALITV